MPGTPGRRDKHNIVKLVKNLGRKEFTKYEPKLIPTSKDSYNFSFADEKEIIHTTPRGDIYEEEIDRMTKIISEKTGISQEDAYNFITKDPVLLGLEKQAVNGALIVLSVALVTLILSQTKLLTGYVISNISNTTSTTGIFICAVGIIGLLIYRRKFK